MNKIIKAVITVLVIITGMNTYCQTVGLTIHDTTVFAGDVINVPVYVLNNLTGRNVLSYQLDISFNSGYLEALEAVSAGTMSSGWASIEYSTEVDGKITVAAAGAAPLAGMGKLIIIRLRCIKAGGINVSFTSSVTNMLNEGDPVVSLDNGYFNIKEKPTITVNPDDGLLTSGDQLQFTVQKGTSPYQWSVTVDSVGSVNSSGLFTALKRGLTRVVAEDATGITDTTDFIEVRGLRLTVRDTSGWQGNVIKIPVYSTNVNNLGIVSGAVTLSFNTNVLLYATEFDKNGTLLESCENISINTSVPGMVSISFAATVPLTGSGPLVYISYMVSNNTGGTNLSFEDAVFNEDILAQTDHGYFTIKSLPVLSVTPNNATLHTGETQQFTAGGGFVPYTWNTTDNTIAEISGTGILTAKKGGIVFVTVSDIIGSNGISQEIFIYDTRISMPDTVSELESTVDIPVNISGLPSGMDVLSMEIIFKSMLPELEPVDIITTGTLTESWSVASHVRDGIMHVAAASATGFDDAGILFYLRLKLTEELTVTEKVAVQIEQIMLNEGSPVAIADAGSITGIFYGDDISLACVTNLADGCELPDPVRFSLTLTNAGGETYYMGDTIPAGLYFPGDPIIPLNLILTRNLPPAATISYFYEVPADPYFEGVFAFKIFADLADDLRRENDTASQSVTIYGYPDVNLGAPFLEVPSFPFILDAGPGFDSYLWQDGSTEQTLSASDYGIYWVEVGLNGCFASDTIDLVPVFIDQKYDRVKLYAYPNPNDGNFDLFIPSGMEDKTIEIFDINGKKVYQKNFDGSKTYIKNIDLTEYGEGMYFLKTGLSVIKIIVH